MNRIETVISSTKTIDMKVEEFYKDHFGHTSQDVSMDKIFVCMELYAKQYLNKRVIEELEKIKGLGVTYTDDVIDKRIKELKQ